MLREEHFCFASPVVVAPQKKAFPLMGEGGTAAGGDE
jgi:hypothetical protein